MNKELLNAMLNLIVDAANENGTCLVEEFENQSNFKNFVISFTIKQVMEVCNMDITEAYDVVMGDGAYETLANDIWEKAQA